jgi:hypothetical protein
MACMKCGSDWVTLKGKDMVSCPECCKQQRCKARKQGRLPAKECRRCERCGCEFTANGGNAIRHARHCSACSEAARREYLQARKDKIKSGEWQAKSQRKLKGRKCVRCERMLKAGQRKYCSRDCFFAAREDGSQPWDRTNQNGSALRRAVANHSSPSSRALSKILNGFSGFMQRLGAFRRIAYRPGCPTCGTHHERPASRFCSNECASHETRQRSCKHCGEQFVSIGAYGAGSRVCKACKKRARQEEVRRRKSKYGRNHRQRARHHGVRYEPVPVKLVYERDNYTCQICLKKCLPKARMHRKTGKIHPRSPSIDHIVAMSRGGEHVEANLQTACFRCNSLKSNKGGGQMRFPIATAEPHARGGLPCRYV